MHYQKNDKYKQIYHLYQDSPKKLHKMNYCNGVEGFINYTLSNSKNISGCGIRCLCKRCKNKKFLSPNVVMMSLLWKWFIEKYLCKFAHGKPYILYETMIGKMVASISSFSNMHRVVDGNSNPYRIMVMNAMKMN